MIHHSWHNEEEVVTRHPCEQTPRTIRRRINIMMILVNPVKPMHLSLIISRLAQGYRQEVLSPRNPRIGRLRRIPSSPTHENENGTPKESQSLSTMTPMSEISTRVDGFDTTTLSAAIDLPVPFPTPFAYEESRSRAGRCQGNLVSKSYKPMPKLKLWHEGMRWIVCQMTRRWLVICRFKTIFNE
jgi:hypothetical protein